MPTFNYATHVWRPKEQDPVCDEIAAAFRETFGPGEAMRRGAYKVGADCPNVSGTTIINWLDGKTISPTNRKINAALNAIGYELRVAKVSGNVVKFPGAQKRVQKRFKTTQQTRRRATA